MTDDRPSTTGTLARAGLIVGALFGLSRAVGWVRTAVIGAIFDAGPELDAFYAAFRIPDLIFQLVAAGALSSALVPIVSGLLATGEPARAWRLVGSIANLMLIGLLALAAVFFVAAPAIMPLITDFQGAQLERTIELTRIMLLGPIFLALGAVASSALNAQGRFAAASFAPVVYNFGIIVGAVLIAPALGTTVDGRQVADPTGLAIGVVIGSAGHLLVQLRPLARNGFRPTAGVDLDDPLARKALALMAPRAVGLGANQIAFVAMTLYATGLPGSGALTAFNFAQTLLQIPLGVIGVPLGIVLLPAMSRELAGGALDGYLGMLQRALRLIAFVMVPITVAAMILRVEIVDLLFRWGAFSVAAVLLTADAFLVFLIGLTAHSLIAVLARAFYAGQDTKTPVSAAVTSVAINIVAGGLLVGPLGLQGLALAIAIGAWVEASILLVILRGRYPALDVAGLGGTVLRAVVAAALAGALTLGVLAVLDGVLPVDGGKLAVLGRLVLAGGAGAVGYLAMSLVLRAPELPALVAVATGLLRRPRAA